jgi:hypothetical protein
MHSFVYKAPNGEVIEVPAHDPKDKTDTTDLASVPRPLWGLLASYGRQLRAALMHDQLCDEATLILKQGDRKLAYTKRKQADELFRLGMRDRGDGSKEALSRRVTWFRSWLFWAGVTFGRYLAFRKIRCLLLSLQALTAALMLYIALGLIDSSLVSDYVPQLGDSQPRYLLYYLALGAASILWGSDRKLPLIGITVAPIFVPVFLITMLGQLVLAIPDILVDVTNPDEPHAHVGQTLMKIGRPKSGSEGNSTMPASNAREAADQARAAGQDRPAPARP